MTPINNIIDINVTTSGGEGLIPKQNRTGIEGDEISRSRDIAVEINDPPCGAYGNRPVGNNVAGDTVIPSCRTDRNATPRLKSSCYPLNLISQLKHSHCRKS